MHLVRPKRGEIYLASITTGAGSALTGQHLVVIISNNKGNLYSDKVMVVPIEGNGNKINPSCHVQLLNADPDFGRLDKTLSRIVVADIMTLDKARLQHRIGAVVPTNMEELDNKISTGAKIVDKDE